MRDSDLQGSPWESLASVQVSSLAWRRVTDAAKRRQKGNRPNQQDEWANPEIPVFGTTDPHSPQGKAEARTPALARVARCSRGPGPRHVSKGSHVNKADPYGFRRDADRTGQAARQGRSDGGTGVGPADSTRRAGKPPTWGSGRRNRNLHRRNMGSLQREIGPSCKGRRFCPPWQQT